MEQLVLSRCVIDHVFPYKKFVTHEEELEYGQNLQRRVCHKLKVKNPKDFWRKRREQVRKRLGRKRNNVSEIVKRKRKMIGKIESGYITSKEIAALTN